MIENKTDDKATNYIENVKVTVENNWKIIEYSGVAEPPNPMK